MAGQPILSHRAAPGVGAPAGTVLDLVERCRVSLTHACIAANPEERYEHAHMAALRAAAAVVAARAMPGKCSRPRSVWELLPGVAPELGEWAIFFDGSARRRAALARGHRASQREADDLVREVESFEQVVRSTLGLPVATATSSLLVGSGNVRGDHDR